jgi:homoserine dehydrogenase
MIGCGTVGSGVLELLLRRSEDLSRVLGRSIHVSRIVVRDLARTRHQLAVWVSRGTEVSDDPRRVTSDPGVDLVVELAGGTEEPRRWMLEALEHRRDVVTANKAALAFHGEELFAAARAQGRAIYYEASVAGAIPIIEMLLNGLVANQMTRISAILNGTCNYILTRMEFDGLEYQAALAEAQAKGFAEADPTLDVSGGDSAHKLALLAGIVTRSHVRVADVYTEGPRADHARGHGVCAQAQLLDQDARDRQADRGRRVGVPSAPHTHPRFRDPCPRSVTSSTRCT